MKTSRHEEALDRQVDLIQWWQTAAGHQFAANYMRTVVNPNLPDTQDDRLGAFLAESQRHALDRAPTYWVSKDMITLVEHASAKGHRDFAGKGMPPQPLHWNDLPTQSGFVYFDRSIYITDARGKKVGFRGVLWCPAFVRTAGNSGAEAINLVFYSDRDEKDDEVYQSWDPQELELFRRTMPKLVLLHLTPWTLEEPWGDEDERLVDGSVTDSRRFMAAFWTIIQDHIIAPAGVPRAFRRRAERIKTTPVNEIKVVTLRKVIRRAHDDEEEHEETSVDWSHRWIVDGFWRNQYYPSTDGHRYIWISPYVKGPEHLPLVVKDKIYKVSR